MKQRTFFTTLIAIVLLAAVIAAGLHAVFTVAYVRASFRTNSPEGEAAAQQLKERLNTYLGSSSTFLDLGEVRATAESDPRFKVVSLEKRLPSAIEVVIEERRAAFEGQQFLVRAVARSLGEHADLFAVFQIAQRGHDRLRVLPVPRDGDGLHLAAHKGQKTVAIQLLFSDEMHPVLGGAGHVRDVPQAVMVADEHARPRADLFLADQLEREQQLRHGAHHALQKSVR